MPVILMLKKLWNLGKEEPLYPRRDGETKKEWLDHAYDELERDYGIMSGEESVALIEGYSITNAFVRAIIIVVPIAIILVLLVK